MKTYTILLVFMMFFINTIVISNTVIKKEVITESIEELEIEIVPGLDEFLHHIGHAESGNDYSKINSIGYLGKYQFGITTIQTLGYKSLTETQFINNPSLQDTMMIKNLRYNKRRLSRYIEKWDGKTRYGVKITESGMLAAAHLAGQGNVKRFLRTGFNPSDINGTNVSKYLSTFAGYDLKLK